MLEIRPEIGLGNNLQPTLVFSCKPHCIEIEKKNHHFINYTINLISISFLSFSFSSFYLFWFFISWPQLCLVRYTSPVMIQLAPTKRISKHQNNSYCSLYEQLPLSTKMIHLLFRLMLYTWVNKTYRLECISICNEDEYEKNDLKFFDKSFSHFEFNTNSNTSEGK